MEYVRAQGFPIPAIEEVGADGFDIVMERIDGANMVSAIQRRPWTIRGQGRVLADLHRQLHSLEAPDWMPDAPVGQGERLLHLDLHPLNVIMSPKGPVVIDWTNACRGDPAVDVAVTWVLMVAGDVPARGPMGRLLARIRSVLVESFLADTDVAGAKGVMRDVVGWKVSDPHLSAVEQRRMWQLVDDIGDGRVR